MVISRGGISGGFTIADALREFERRGYDGEFIVRGGGRIECSRCHTRSAASDVPLEAMRRIEGVSDPADETLVGALACPVCDQHGTLTLQYGAMAPAEDAEVLRNLDNHRISTELSQRAESADSSLVSDTGWLDRRGAED